MNEHEAMRPGLSRYHTPLEQTIRFMMNLIGLWILCACGIYLIGPDEPQHVEATAVAQLHAQFTRSPNQE